MEQGLQRQKIVCLLADSFVGMSALKKIVQTVNSLLSIALQQFRKYQAGKYATQNI